MTIRSFVVAAGLAMFVSLPAGAGQPNLPNGDAVDVTGACRDNESCDSSASVALDLRISEFLKIVSEMS